MICPRCQCAIPPPAKRHVKWEECIAALLEWRGEAELRLIAYEERSAVRDERIRDLEAEMESMRDDLRHALRTADT